MSDLDKRLFTVIREVVRAEVRAALAAATVPEKFLCITAAARLASVTTRSIGRLVTVGRLTRYHAGRELRISWRELEDFMRCDGVVDGDLTPVGDK